MMDNPSLPQRTETPTINEFVLRLPLQERKLFDNFVAYGSRSLVDIQRYIIEGYEIQYSLKEIGDWKQSSDNSSGAVAQINLTTSQYRGINEISELEYQVGKLHEQLGFLQKIIDTHCNLVDPQDAEAILQRDMALQELQNQGAPPLQYCFDTTPKLINELNKLVSNLNKMKFIENRAELILTGADHVLQVMETSAKKLPQGEEIVKALVASAWASVKASVNKQ